MDVSQLSREELEDALLKQTQVAKQMRMQRDRYHKELDNLHTQYLQLSQVTLTMRNIAQQIIMVGSDGQDSFLQTAPLARPEDS